MIFWQLWECLTIPTKTTVSICRKLSWLYACKKSASSLTFFLKYCKELANLLFWVFEHASPHLKWYYQFEEIFDVYLKAKNQLHSFHFPWDTAKTLQICYSGYFGKAYLHTPRMILATCRKLSYLSASKITTSSIMFF